MRTIKRLAVMGSWMLILVLVSVWGGASWAGPLDPLEGLTSKSGWVMLGLRKASNDEHDSPWFGEPSFEFESGPLVRVPANHRPMPSPNDRISFKNPQMVHIVGFWPDKDERGLGIVPAWNGGWVDDKDRTKIVLPAKAVVRVEASAVVKSIQGDKWIAWARVSHDN